jgi:chemotaxis family two-component system sensor kinase Cph1
VTIHTGTKSVNSAAALRGQEPYSTKRHGLDITNCDSEPVQTPGCVQAHGAMLVVRLADLCILQASENFAAVVGLSVAPLLNGSVAAVLGAQGEAQLRTFLARQSIDRNPVYLSTLAADFHDGDAHGAVDVTVHTIDGVAILEFEPTGYTDADSSDHYALVKKMVARLQSTNSLLQFCDLAAAEIRELTGMDRVMVYKFHEDGHGEVFAESKGADLAPWIGLHYPAEDIPKPARDVFMRTWLRPIPDMNDELAEMVPLVNPDTGKPLDMTFCHLRGVSRMCTEYYRNMGVGSTLTLSIRRGDHLWGLFSCICYARPRYLSYQVRAACEFLAQVVSLQHNSAEDKDTLAYRLQLEGVHQALLTNAARLGGLVALANGTPSLLDGVDATGAALYHDGRWHRLGTTPGESQLEELGRWLIATRLVAGAPTLYATDCLTRDYAPGAAFADVASGLLALLLVQGGRDLMLWFRPQTMQTVKWGGDPSDKPVQFGPNGPRLTPRKSFEVFVESVRERSLPWQKVELDAVTKLRLQLAETVVDNVEQRVALNARLTRSIEELDAFTYVARHDLKEPLRGIHNYAFQLMQDAALLDENDRGKLDRMLRLARRMDSLLDSLLHFSRAGKADFTLELVDLNEVVAEAIEMVRLTPDGPLNVVIPRAFPVARCNRGWCREIFVNLLSNAIRYSDSASRRIEIGFIAVGETHRRPSCPPGSKEDAIYFVADNGLGIEEKYFSQIFKLFKRLHGREDYGGGAGTGLTVVRKLVERHGGKIWLDSLPGAGTTFYFTLPSDGPG